MMARRNMIALLATAAVAQTPAPKRVRSLKITILTTMLTDRVGIGEWGFAALVEADGRRILFDTGARPDTLTTNLKELGLDVTGVQDVVLSHNHGDHTVGLASVKSRIAGAKIHAAKGIFYSRPGPRGEGNHLVKVRAQLAGLNFVEHDGPFEVAPAIWFLGPIPRKYPERNATGLGKIATPTGVEDDTVPEDSSLVFDTDQGLVVLSGCGHAGIANTLDYARTAVRSAPVYAAIGGWHLFQLSDERLQWTAARLREFGVQHLFGAHCTGLEAVYRIRDLNRMPREKCVVGAVGSTFDLAKGIGAGWIAR